MKAFPLLSAERAPFATNRVRNVLTVFCFQPCPEGRASKTSVAAIGPVDQMTLITSHSEPEIFGGICRTTVGGQYYTCRISRVKFLLSCPRGLSSPYPTANILSLGQNQRLENGSVGEPKPNQSIHL